MCWRWGESFLSFILFFLFECVIHVVCFDRRCTTTLYFSSSPSSSFSCCALSFSFTHLPIEKVVTSVLCFFFFSTPGRFTLSRALPSAVLRAALPNYFKSVAEYALLLLSFFFYFFRSSASSKCTLPLVAYFFSSWLVWKWAADDDADVLVMPQQSPIPHLRCVIEVTGCNV